jgi:hypothetical protein
MTQEMTQALFEVARLIGAGVVGGLIATYASHRLALSRERDSERRDRKREFRSFIVRLKFDATAVGTIGHLDRSRSFAYFYREKKPELRAAAANVEDDFSRKRRAEFDRLVNTAAGFPDAEAMADDGKKRIVGSLDAIRGFLDR